MKQLLIVMLTLAALVAVGMTNLERYRLRAVAERPRCESRQPVVIGGVTNIVETWRRGQYTWSQTNAVKNIVGKFQTNTFAERIAEARASAEEWKSKWTVATNSLSLAEARLAIVEAKAERSNRLKTWLEEQRDKALLDSTKKLYQNIIDRLEGGDQ